MKANVLKFVDHAAKLASGSWAIIGLYDQINAEAFPAPVPIGVFFEIDFDQDEVGTEQHFQFRLIDEDGRVVLDAGCHVRMHTAQAGRQSRMAEYFRFGGFSLPKPGTYRLELSHKGALLAEERLFVVPALRAA